MQWAEGEGWGAVGKEIVECGLSWKFGGLMRYLQINKGMISIPTFLPNPLENLPRKIKGGKIS